MRRERGAVFVVTLAILTVMVAIVASVAATEQVAIKEQIHRSEQLRARTAAEAAIQRAVETLCDEGTSGSTTTSSGAGIQGSNSDLPGAKTLQDDWATLGASGGSPGSDRFQLKDATFRLQVIDASSRININTAAQAQLQNLPLTQEQIDSLLDWRTAGETAHPDGAKDPYYNGLPNPYDTALQPLQTVDELLDIQWFSAADLYDPPVNQPLGGIELGDFPDGRTVTMAEILTTNSSTASVNGQGRALTAITGAPASAFGMFGTLSPQQNAVLNTLRRSTTWAQLIRSLPSFTTAQLRNLLNTYYVGTSNQAGKINVNTAPQAVLQTIPGISQDEATTIVNQQSNGITSMGNILTIPGLTTVRSLSGVIDLLTVNSNVFIVRVIGTAGQASVPLEAVVSITTPTSSTSATATILRMDEQPFNDMTGRWGWETATQNDVPLEAGS